MTNKTRVSSEDCPEIEGLSDQELLNRVISSGDQEAFRLIVVRHGPLVMRVCKRLLRNVHDAEDAFQATFLVLAEKCRRIRSRKSLASWLYGTAYRVAMRAVHRARRQPLPLSHQLISDDNTLEHVASRESEWIMYEELAQLPERYREPLVLCCLQGKSREEAAHELRCSVDTVKGRLERGRRQLRLRLTARGVTMTSISIVAVPVAARLVSESLISSTVGIAAKVVKGGRIPENLRNLVQSGSTMPACASWAAALSAFLVALVFAFRLTAVSEAQAADDTVEIPSVVSAVQMQRTSPVITLTAANVQSAANDEEQSPSDRATKLLEACLATQSAMESYSATVKIRSRSEFQGNVARRTEKVTVAMKGDQYLVEGSRQRGGDSETIRHGQSDKYFLLDHDVIGASFSKDRKYRLTSVQGAYLDGYFGGFVSHSNERIAAIMLKSGNAKWVGSEVVGGESTEKVVSQVEGGRATLWIAPARQHVTLKVLIELQDQTQSLSQVKTKVISGTIVPVSGTFRFVSGDAREEISISRSRVKLAEPAEDSLAMNLPNGTLLYDSDGPDSDDFTHMMKDGTIVPVDYSYVAKVTANKSSMARWRWYLAAVIGGGALAFLGVRVVGYMKSA